MTLLVKDANTSVQSLSTVIDGNGALVPVHTPQIAHVADVLDHSQIRIETEGLSEITGLGARLPRRPAKNFGTAATCLHAHRSSC